MAARLQVERDSPIIGTVDPVRGAMSEAGTVEVVHRGEQFRAAYSVKNGMVHILTTLGRKPPRAPAGSPPQAVARLMLKELLHERDAQARRR
jgi:hypothetical protein